MKNLLIHPEFEEIRIERKEGELLFCVADVCDALGLTHTTNAVQALDDDERMNVKILHAGQIREILFVTESGLYTVIMRSNKPKAKAFRRWVKGEVLPSIRKNGFYVHPSVMSRRDMAKQMKQMHRNLERYVYACDVERIRKKFRVTDYYVDGVIAGSRQDNAVMQDLQKSALVNKNREIDAYRLDRVMEITGKLGVPKK